MLEIIRFGTAINFSIMNEGLSLKALSGLRELASLKDCNFQFYSEDLHYSICNWSTVYRKSFVRDLVDKIKEIAGVDLDFRVQVIINTYNYDYSLEEYISRYADVG